MENLNKVVIGRIELQINSCLFNLRDLGAINQTQVKEICSILRKYISKEDEEEKCQKKNQD